MLPFNAAALVATVHGPWQLAAVIAVLAFLYLKGRAPPGRR